MTTRTSRTAICTTLGVAALTLAAIVPGADGADEGSVVSTVQVAESMRSITVSRSTLSLTNCVDADGGATAGKLLLPNGVCAGASPPLPITVTNTGAASNIVVSTTGAGGSVQSPSPPPPWVACGGAGSPACTGPAGRPGPDQARMCMNVSGVNGCQVLGSTPAKERGFGATEEPNASPGEVHFYNLSITAPSSSTSSSPTRQFSVSWKAQPALPAS